MNTKGNANAGNPADNQTGKGASQQQGTEAEAKGGIEPAKNAAERDWQDTSQESGE